MSNSRGRRALVAVALGCSLGVLSGCDDLLDVTLPAKLTDEAVNDPNSAETLRNSIITEFEWSLNYLLWFNHGREDGGEIILGSPGIDRGGFDWPAGAANDEWFPSLHTSRRFAVDIHDKLMNDENWGIANVPLGNQYRAQSSIYQGAAVGYLGGMLCEISIAGGTLHTPEETMTMAEGLISRGLSEIGSAGGDFAMPFGIASSAEAMAYGLRAQIRFRKGDMAGAVSDAQQVPKEFIAWVTRDAGPFRRNKAYYDGTFIRYARLNGVNDWWEGDPNPVNGVPWPAVIPFTGFRNLGILPDGRAVREDGIPIRTDGQYRTPVEDIAVPDTRVQFVEGIIQGDANQTFINARYDSEDSDYPLVNWKEMWLIRAEGLGGQGAIDLVNELRAFDNLPLVTYADPGNAQQIRYMIVEERRRTLYVEGQFYFTKLRNLDLLWFPRAQGIVPARGLLYGGGVRMHMPNDEFTLNENLTLDDRATGCAVNERPVRFQ